jgi:hypothetical protein
MQPWTTFFNGDNASNKLTAATLHPQRLAQGCFYPAQARHGPGQFFIVPLGLQLGNLALESRDLPTAQASSGLGRGMHVADRRKLLHPIAQLGRMINQGLLRPAHTKRHDP